MVVAQAGHARVTMPQCVRTTLGADEQPPVLTSALGRQRVQGPHGAGERAVQQELRPQLGL